MQFRDVVRRRRMVRAFTDEPVDPRALDRVLDAANRAPSAGFSQGQAWLVLTDEADRERFWGMQSDAGDTVWAGEGTRHAPVVVVPLASADVYLDRYAEPDKGWTDRDEGRWPVPYWYVDTGMAAENLLLAVVDEGLGALFFGIPTPLWAVFRSTFEVPESWDPVGAVAIGHPDDRDREPRASGHTRARRDLDEVVHRGRW